MKVIKSPQKLNDPLNSIKSKGCSKTNNNKNVSIINVVGLRRSSRILEKQKGITNSVKDATIPDCKDDIYDDHPTRDYDEPIPYDSYFTEMEKQNVSLSVGIRMLELYDNSVDKALEAFAADNSLPTKFGHKKVDLNPWTLNEISILLDQMKITSKPNKEDEENKPEKIAWKNQKLQIVASMISKPFSSVLNVYYLLKNEICHHRVKFAFCEDIKCAFESPKQQQPYGCFEKLLSNFFIREENEESLPSCSSALSMTKLETDSITIFHFDKTNLSSKEEEEPASFKHSSIKMDKTNEMYNDAFKIGNGSSKCHINTFTELWLIDSNPYWKCTKCQPNNKITFFVCRKNNAENMRQHFRRHHLHPKSSGKQKC